MALTTSTGNLAGALQIDLEHFQELSELVSAVLVIDNLRGSSLREKWRACSEAMFQNNIKTREKAKAALAKRVSRDLPRQLPGDVLYLHRPFPTAGTGYMALARFPVEVDRDAIAIAPADMVYGAAAYRRVARLASPYRYRITQLFAEVYSAIGLPEEYEAARVSQFTQLAERIDSDLER